MARDLYQDVTDRIIAELETGTAPWVKPWAGGASVLPFNASTGKRYRGINIALLMGSAADYGHGGFVTFKQALDMGGHVRKGERGHLVVFWNFIKQKETSASAGAAADDGEEKLIPFARAYTVFNVTQCEGLNLAPPATVAAINPDAPDADLDQLIGNIGASIKTGGNGAFYSPAADYVQMPAFSAFRDASNYYATLLHELTHWTAHPSRLARDLSGRFGSNAYAAEELVAELGAAFMCADHGVTGQLQHAAYIKSWLEVLKQDKRAIFTAASKAQQAADYLNAAMAQGEQLAA